MFWALAAFCALLIDRDRSRELLARKVGALLDAGARRGSARAALRAVAGLRVRGAGWPGCAWAWPRAPSGRACSSWSSSA